MQYHRIRLNRAFSGATVPLNTALKNYNGYYVYGNTIGRGIVTTFNVRAFLNDPRNEVIARDFVAYLTGYTTQEQFAQIAGSDQELAEVFNEFYETTVMSGVQTPPDVIDANLVQTATVQFHETDHAWNGMAPPQALDNIPLPIDGADRVNVSYGITTKYSVDPSYYIPVFIARNYLTDAKDRYDDCPTRLSQLLNPDSFSGVDTMVQTERTRNEIVVIQSELPSTSFSVFNVNDFSNAAQDLIARCYGSQCVDNRHCDLLYFSHRRLMEINTVEPHYVQDMMGDESAFTSANVLSVLLRQLSMNGRPVRSEIYSCLIERQSNRA